MNEAAPISEKPNILFVFADQLQAFALGCMENPLVLTPNLDALAADGVLFRNAYSDSPVCTPHRGCLMTGRYPAQSGIRWNNDPIPQGERCLGHSLSDAGYATSYVGKWHLGASGNIPIEPDNRGGFERFTGYQCYNSFIDNVCFFDEEGTCRRFECHRTQATTDLALERMEAIKDCPFAQFVSYQNPHYPLEPSPEFAALYRNAEIPVRPNHQPCEVYTPTGSPPSPKPKEADPNYQRYGGSYQEFMRCYYAMVTQLDHEFGRLVRWLRNRGLYEKTLIIFSSDHGENACSHGLMNKGDWWEESARVPLIVRAPGGLRGHCVEAPVSAGVDVWPTLVDFAGYAEEKELSGTSWKGLAVDAGATRTEPVFSEFPLIHQEDHNFWVMVREGDWKLIARQEGLEPLGLYNLRDDPYELNDLKEDTVHIATRARLLDHLRGWLDRAPDYARRSANHERWMKILGQIGGAKA